MSDLERKLLARLSTPEAISEVWDIGVRGELFEEPLYQAVFNWTTKYWQSAQLKSAPTPWALTQEFPGYEVHDDADEETGYLASLLQRRYTTNQLQTMIRKATETMHADPVDTLKVLHASAFAASEAVTKRITRENMADTVQERRQEYAEGAQYPQGMGVPFGLDLLDLHTGGILPGEVAVVGAVAKTGKTTFLLASAAKAVRQGYRPIVFSLEMSRKEVRKRIDALFSGVSYNRLIKSQLHIDEMKTLYAAQEELSELGGIEIECPEIGDRTVASLLARARQYGSDYLIIDQLSHMEPGHKVMSLKEHHGTIMTQLSNECSRPGSEIPCLLAAQLRQGDEVISMESFANAAEVVREADIAIGLWRNKNLRQNAMMGCNILASRRSDIAEYLLYWQLTEHTNISMAEEVRNNG